MRDSELDGDQITTYLTLETDGVIATRTPEGVGSLSDDDHVAIETARVDTIEHGVTQNQS